LPSRWRRRPQAVSAANSTSCTRTVIDREYVVTTLNQLQFRIRVCVSHTSSGGSSLYHSRGLDFVDRPGSAMFSKRGIRGALL
jgi:hypothetical protein